MLSLPKFTVQAIAGPDVGQKAQSIDGRLTVGTAEGTVLRLTDPTVSRYHVELEATAQGVVVRDLGSTNRTLLGGVSIRETAVTRESSSTSGAPRVQRQLRRREGDGHHEFGARVPRLVGRVAGDEARVRRDRDGRAHQRAGPHHGRERHGQRARRARHPRREPARERAVRGRRLRRPSGHAHRERAFRARARRIHRRHGRARGRLRARRRRHAVPRRARRAPARAAAEAPCARSARARFAASAARDRSRSTCASSPPPTATSAAT